MLKTSIISTIFSGVRFQSILNVECTDAPKPDFPGLDQAQSNDLDFELPTALVLTVYDKDSNEVVQELNYYDLLLLSSFDDVIPTRFSKLLSIQISLEQEKKERFISELFFVVSRFLLHYAPSGVELYQALRNADLSVTILWRYFGLRWITWNGIVSNNREAPIYVNSILVVLLRLRELPLCLPNFAEEVNKYALKNKAFFSLDKIERSRIHLPKAFSNIKYLSEEVSCCEFPLVKESLDALTAGIEFTCALSGEVIKLNIFETLQCNIFIELPERIEHSIVNNPFNIDALKAICWPYFLTGNPNKIDAIYALDVFKVGKHHIYNVGIPKALEYYRTTANDKTKANIGIFTSMLMLIWDAKGSYKPIYPQI